jgi:hypothetical protein
VTPRPDIAPAVAAELLAGAPARLAKKLDAEPAMAEAWTWSREGDTWTVATAKGETVALHTSGGLVARADAVRCSCLLSPRCLHVIAVIARLATAEPEPVEAPPPAAPPPETRPVDLDRKAAAGNAFRVGASLLAVGADGAGAALLAELLRAIHGCRLAGAHRVAAAASRVARWIQELHGDRPEFSLSGLTDDLRELLTAAHIVSTAAEVDPAWIGTARREYAPAGHLRLYGVFTEAVVARGGYAGVVTYLTDGEGRLFTRGEVAPGEVDRAVAAYDAAAGIGDAVLPHRDLCRAGLFVSDATISADGRLGAGASVKAVRAQSPSLWTDDAVAGLWATPLSAQLDRMGKAEDRPVDARPAGWDLAFIDGCVLGVVDGALLLETSPAPNGGNIPLRLVPGSAHERLRYRENLATLGRMSGSRVRCVGRIRPDEPRTIALLAVGPLESSDLVLPAPMLGRANAGLDLIHGAPGSVQPSPGHQTPPTSDPLASLRRRIQRVSRGGISSLPPEAAREIERESAVLEQRLMGGAAAVLRDLVAAAAPPDRTFTGVRRAADPVPFACVWLRAARYEVAARRTIARERWLMA